MVDFNKGDREGSRGRSKEQEESGHAWERSGSVGPGTGPVTPGTTVPGSKAAKPSLDHFLMKSEAVMYLFLVQGIYYMITGIWPLLDIDSFMAVTGPKLEIWLVKTVGMTVLVTGSTLLLASLLRSGNRPLVLLAAGSALGFILIDVIYVVRGVIPLIYLLDAVLQLILLLVWTRSFFRVRKEFLVAKKKAKQAGKGGSSQLETGSPPLT